MLEFMHFDFVWGKYSYFVYLRTEFNLSWLKKRPYFKASVQYAKVMKKINKFWYNSTKNHLNSENILTYLIKRQPLKKGIEKQKIVQIEPDSQ